MAMIFGSLERCASYKLGFEYATYVIGLAVLSQNPHPEP